MRLIDADELRKMLVNHKKTQARGHFGPYMEGIYCGFNKSLSDIESAPTIDAEPVRHAYWIGSDAYGEADGFPVYDTFECSECHDWYDNCDGTPPPHNYCPNCGAKMDGNGERKTEK